MPESSLSLAYDDLRQEVADFLGFERTIANWTAAQKDQIDAVVESGLRQFYYPPVLPNAAAPHEWSFLRPLATLVTTADVSDYPLPDNCGGIAEDLYYDSADGGWQEVRIVPWSLIAERRQAGGDVKGRPRYAAVTPIIPTGLVGQRFQVAIWPKPAGKYTLHYRYFVLPNVLDATDFKYPYGGAEHADTIKYSCLAAAELDRDNAPGPMKMMFVERLRASVALDAMRKGPHWFEPNRDAGMHRLGGYLRYPSQGITTYNGTQYGPH